MFGDRAIGARIVSVRAKSVLGHHRGRVVLLATNEQTELGKIAGRPARQFLEALEPALVVTTPPRRIRRLRGRLQLDEGARRRALPDERDIRPPDAGVTIFG